MAQESRLHQGCDLAAAPSVPLSQSPVSVRCFLPRWGRIDGRKHVDGSGSCGISSPRSLGQLVKSNLILPEPGRPRTTQRPRRRTAQWSRTWSADLARNGLASRCSPGSCTSITLRSNPKDSSSIRSLRSRSNAPGIAGSLRRAPLPPPMRTAPAIGNQRKCPECAWHPASSSCRRPPGDQRGFGLARQRHLTGFHTVSCANNAAVE